MKIYFSHDVDARNDQKIVRMRMDFGWFGYGVYWALVELLRGEDGDYKLRRDYEAIAYALNCDFEQVKSIIENYKLFDFDENFFWSNSLLKRMQKKKALATRAANLRWSKSMKKK